MSFNFKCIQSKDDTFLRMEDIIFYESDDIF